MMRMRLLVAGVSVALEASGRFDRDRLRARFGAYEIEPSGPPDASLRLVVEPTGKLLVPADVPYPAVKAYPTAEGVKMLREGLSLWVGRDLCAEAFVRGPEKISPSPEERDAGPADTPLRILVSLALLRSGRGALMHAAGGVRRGAGLLFLGEGGAGKTTLARLLPDGSVLSDDQVALCAGGEGAMAVEATPFVGMLGRPCAPRRAPLGAVVLLDRSRKGVCEQVPRAERAGKLMRCLPLYARDGGDAAAALSLVARLAGEAPVLRGSPDLGEGLEPWLERVERAARG